jgi:hypothetical protein
MRRTYGTREFRDLDDEMRGTIPNLGLTTDVIVGFPTQAPAEYEDTRRTMEDVRFDAAFIFKYSERKGTYAERKLPDDVRPKRKRAIIELGPAEITGEINTRSWARAGRAIEDVVEKQPGLVRPQIPSHTIFRGGTEVGDTSRRDRTRPRDTVQPRVKSTHRANDAQSWSPDITVISTQRTATSHTDLSNANEPHAPPHAAACPKLRQIGEGKPKGAATRRARAAPRVAEPMWALVYDIEKDKWKRRRLPRAGGGRDHPSILRRRRGDLGQVHGFAVDAGIWFRSTFRP